MKKRSSLLLGLVLTGAFLLFLFCQTAFFAPAGISVHSTRHVPPEDYRIDLNQASAEELSQLSGLGPVLSEAIVAWREKHGCFQTAEDLLKVPGIGEKTFIGIRDYIYPGESDSYEDRGQ